jgi:TM2 domain-containing membrane protein YozV
VPGLGTIINGETGKGVLILGAWLIGWLLVLAVIGILVVPAVWLYGMYDGYQGARRYNLAHRPGGPGA